MPVAPYSQVSGESIGASTVWLGLGSGTSHMCTTLSFDLRAQLAASELLLTSEGQDKRTLRRAIDRRYVNEYKVSCTGLDIECVNCIVDGLYDGFQVVDVVTTAIVDPHKHN